MRFELYIYDILMICKLYLELMKQKISALQHNILLIDWTEKCYSNVYSSVDCHVLSETLDDEKKNDEDIEIRNNIGYSSDETYDSSDCTDSEEDECCQNDKDYKQRKRAYRLKVSFQIITSEWNYILDHSLVPKGEAKEYLVPRITEVVDRNLKYGVKKYVEPIQLRTDGFNANINVSREVKTQLINMYAKDGCVLISINGDIKYAIQMIVLLVCIYIIFISYLYIYIFDGSFIYQYTYHTYIIYTLYSVCIAICMWFSSNIIINYCSWKKKGK